MLYTRIDRFQPHRQLPVQRFPRYRRSSSRWNWEKICGPRCFADRWRKEHDVSFFRAPAFSLEHGIPNCSPTIRAAVSSRRDDLRSLSIVRENPWEERRASYERQDRFVNLSAGKKHLLRLIHLRWIADFAESLREFVEWLTRGVTGRKYVDDGMNRRSRRDKANQ